MRQSRQHGLAHQQLERKRAANFEQLARISAASQMLHHNAILQQVGNTVNTLRNQTPTPLQLRTIPDTGLGDLLTAKMQSALESAMKKWKDPFGVQTITQTVNLPPTANPFTSGRTEEDRNSDAANRPASFGEQQRERGVPLNIPSARGPANHGRVSIGMAIDPDATMGSPSRTRALARSPSAPSEEETKDPAEEARIAELRARAIASMSRGATPAASMPPTSPEGTPPGLAAQVPSSPGRSPTGSPAPAAPATPSIRSAQGIPAPDTVRTDVPWKNEHGKLHKLQIAKIKRVRLKHGVKEFNFFDNEADERDRVKHWWALKG